MPVRVEEFADPAVRERWIREKNMRVFQMYHDERRVTVAIERLRDLEAMIDFNATVEARNPRVKRVAEALRREEEIG